MSREIVEAVRGLAAEKNISHEKLMEALEDALFGVGRNDLGDELAKSVQHQGLCRLRFDR